MLIFQKRLFKQDWWKINIIQLKNKFSDYDINKFILLLRKGVYPYAYMNDYKKVNETILHEKEEFYSNLITEDVTDTDYMHAKRVRKDFEIKDLADYHDLHLKSNTLLLADIFQNFKALIKLSFRSCIFF